ncbi:MAG: gamma-glutamyl-gamma-aminobutyrate hydrolase family protein [Tannerellaceae bacterium]|jgi:microsomal dipeptidase-like Zn-dependent dipeptidase/gamma-glutamyl-gamma-aminobutyrate hydrolase PuuD|nr:gamma-glutamyl-gamma-aminobutyrate hydrolase family protein [Tannerellaceae bacterium]
MKTQVRPPDLKSLFGEVDNFVPEGGKTQQPPRIGISANRKEGTSCIAETYVQSVVGAGGAPVLIPVITDIQALIVIVDGLDGLLISGGADLNPLYLGEEPIPQLEEVDTFRDEYDLILLRLAFNRGLPILGICRGHQLIHAAFGGKLCQDIGTRREPTLKHSQTQARELPSHSVALTDKNSKLYAILKNGKVLVNSFHHQAVEEPAPEFITTALAPDGINEGAEHPEYPILSIQWHPEAMAPHGDKQMQALFAHHVAEAGLFARAKELHRQILTLDLHTDAPMVYSGAFDLGKRTSGIYNPPFTEGKVNLPLMEAGRLDAVFMVAYVPQGERTETAYREVYDYTLDRLSQVVRQEELHPARVGIARTPGDLLRLKQEGKKAIVAGVENGYAIGKDISRLEELKQRGVAYITLCHNGHNDICDSAVGEPLWNGLSPFGKEVVHEMNRLGMMIDVSHAAETTFYDVLKESRLPLIASHSSVRALCDHPRNLTDEQIKALAAKGGVVHICLYTGFIKQGTEMESPCGLSEAIHHINHVVNLVGIDYVGIGSDFDGGGGLVGCRASNELIHITVRLLKEGYTEADIQKIWGANLLRVMEKVQSAGQ